MKIRDLMRLYESFCSQELALDGDPVGLQIGSPDTEITKTLITLDIREQTVAEAIEKGANLIIAKHPVIFSPLANLTDQNTQEALVLKLIQHDISVYTSHTNIDRVENGLNDYFCQLLGLHDLGYFNPENLGRIGNMEPLSLLQLTEKIKQVFGQERLRVVSYDHSLSQIISRVAICGGSGGKFWPEAKAAGADCYITADIYYHSAHDLLSSGLVAIDPGHYMEKLFIPLAAEKLRSFNTDVPILESQAMTNPFYDI